MTLKTLADVRGFLKHLPKERRQNETWQVVVRRLDAAATGGSVDDLSIALQMAFSWNGLNIRFKLHFVCDY